MTLRRIVSLAAIVLLAVLLPVSAAHAHNSLESSSPADGAVLDAAPANVVLVFTGSVPLESVSAVLTDPSGVRTELTQFTHGTSDREVVVALPVLANGAYSFRWQLVGDDGHVVTDRVAFTVATTASEPASGTPTTSLPTAIPTDQTSIDDDAPPSTPSALRWLLRVAAYVSLLAAAALLMVEVLTAAPARSAALLRWVRLSLAVCASTAALQWLVLAGDIEGAWPWAAWGGLGAAADTNPGAAYVARVVLCGAAALLMGSGRPAHHDVYLGAMSVVGTGLLGTWAFAGHAASLDRPTLGVVLDIAHHGAAAAWLGGLGALWWLASRPSAEPPIAEIVPRFSRVATGAVVVLVATGVAQALRLHGGLPDLSTSHGRLLIAKVVGVGVMLAFAARNRTVTTASTLRRGVAIEAGVGLGIIAVTAALVASTPA